VEKYLDTFINGYKNYASYLWGEITHPHWSNYFYWLILVSLIFFILEIAIPWRKKQALFRKDFWMDGFYMFFNFFLFSLIIYNAASDVVVVFFNDIIKSLSGGFDLQASNPMQSWPAWAILLTGFLLRDFIQWWIHRLLHKSPWLWQFHKVHHSVEEMGFAAHLRYHWMENIVYRTLEYIPLALIGIGLHDFFMIHIFTLIWGHYNHSNISVDGRWSGGVLGILIGFGLMHTMFDSGVLLSTQIAYIAILYVCSMLFGAFIIGPFIKKIFNSPDMHIWHHAHDLPEGKETGVNFGLTLAIWDYLFTTAYVPHSGKDIKLGFPGMESFPKNFVDQNTYGILKSKKGKD